MSQSLLALARKELRSYFSSPIAYIVLGMFSLLYGYFYVAILAYFVRQGMQMEQGVAKMRPVEGGLEIKPGETVELKPGSFHVMLMGLKQPLQKGEKVKGTLEFEKAGKVDIEFAVEALGATAPTAGEHQH